MTQQEFQSRVGYEVTAAQYEGIQALYMATKMDKDAFCEAYLTRGECPEDCAIVRDLMQSLDAEKKYALQLHGELEELNEKLSEAADLLLYDARRNRSMDASKSAVVILGNAEVIRRKIERGYPLWREDLDYIAENIRDTRNQEEGSHES